MEATITTTRRGAKAEWEVARGYDEAERGEVTQLAVLTVMHFGRAEFYGQAEYCYVVRLDREDNIDRDGYTIRKQTLGIGRDYGVKLDLRGGCKRFSAKTAAALLDEWVGKVETLRDAGSADIAALFVADEGKVAA